MKRIMKKNVINKIDQWPSYCSNSLVGESQIFTHNGRFQVLDPVESKMPRHTPKPKLLQFFEEYIKGEFKKHGINDEVDSPIKLQVYREIFQWLIESFRTYQSLLAKIKREYEIHLTKLHDKIRELEPLKEMLWTVTEEKDQEILNIKQGEKTYINSLLADKQRLESLIHEKESKEAVLEVEIERLKSDLTKEHLAFRHESDARKLLIMDMNELKTQIRDMIRIKNERDARMLNEDPVIMRLALEEAKKAQSEAIREVVEIKALYFDVVPITKFEKLNLAYYTLTSEHKAKLMNIADLENQLSEFVLKYESLLQQRDFYYLKYMDLSKSNAGQKSIMSVVAETEKTIDLVTKGMDQWQNLAGKRPTIIAETILSDLKDVNNLEKIPRGSDENAESNQDLFMEANESVAAIRTVMEMMCELPPGSISYAFDPLSLLPMLNKEKQKRENRSSQNSKSKSKQGPH